MVTKITPAPLPLPVPSVSQPVAPSFDRLKAAAKIKASRHNSVAAVARELGYERQTIGHWLRGRGEPDMQQLHALAKALDCHWLELVNEDATILNDPTEKRRVERMRALDPAKLALIDSLLDSLKTGDE